MAFKFKHSTDESDKVRKFLSKIYNGCCLRFCYTSLFKFVVTFGSVGFVQTEYDKTNLFGLVPTISSASFWTLVYVHAKCD